MRGISFILALFLAAVSFVVAAPSSSGTSSVQDITNAIQGASLKINTISSSLSSASTQSSPDVNSVSEYFVQVTTIIQTTTGELQGLNGVDLSHVDVTDLCGAISALLYLVVALLEAVLALVKALTTDVLCTLEAVICDLMKAITALLDCLAPFLVGSLGTLLCAVVKLILKLVACVLALVST